jgi:hypothetical protein
MWPRLALVFLLAAPATARAHWAVLPFQSNVDDARVGETFRELLAEELQREGTPVQLVDAAICRDALCARQVGEQVKADVAIYGSLRQLGSNVIVMATAVNVKDGSVRSSSSMTAEKVEELDKVAARMGRAIELGTTADSTVALGTVTQHEIPAPDRRKGSRGAALRFAMEGPLDAHADRQFGMLLGLGYWFEASDFALEPRIAYAFDVDPGPGSWFEVPMELGAYYVFSRSDLAPLLGGGAGLTYFEETVHRTTTQGGTILVQAEHVDVQGAWGASVFGRAGFLLFRTYEMRVALSAEYRALFLDVHGATPQSLSAVMEVMF